MTLISAWFLPILFPGMIPKTTSHLTNPSFPTHPQSLLRAGADIEDVVLHNYFNWLQGELKSNDKSQILPALTCLARIFRRPRFRVEFCKDSSLFDTLRLLVTVDAPIQQQYQAILCCWTLAFSSQAIAAMGKSVCLE